MNDLSFALFSPPLLVLYGILMVLLAEIIAPNRAEANVRALSPVISLLALLFALVVVVTRWSGATSATGFSGMVTLDRFALFAMAVLCVAGLLAVLSAWSYLRTVGEDHGEYYALLLVAW
jgi:NADH:ubiquinone oxidoreductase subunit 2 (subunit N)